MVTKLLKSFYFSFNSVVKSKILSITKMSRKWHRPFTKQTTGRQSMGTRLTGKLYISTDRGLELAWGKARVFFCLPYQGGVRPV